MLWSGRIQYVIGGLEVGFLYAFCDTRGCTRVKVNHWRVQSWQSALTSLAGTLLRHVYLQHEPPPLLLTGRRIAFFL